MNASENVKLQHILIPNINMLNQQEKELQLNHTPSLKQG
jgi:hypothetical protein